MTALRRPTSLSDPLRAAAHVCSVVDARLYQQRTLMVVTADLGDQPIHHVEVVGCSPEPSPTECASVLDNLLAAVESASDGTPPHGLVLAVTRPGGEGVQTGDRRWLRAFHRVCHTRGIRPLGVYIVGAQGARAICVDDAA